MAENLCFLPSIKIMTPQLIHLKKLKPKHLITPSNAALISPNPSASLNQPIKDGSAEQFLQNNSIAGWCLMELGKYLDET
jgi:hypothetical protein